MNHLRGLEPPTEESIWQWAERGNIILTPRQPTAFHGVYNCDLTPYLRGIYDAINDPAIETVTICKGAQTGATLMAHICVAYWVAENPGPVLVVMPTGDLAKSCSETRIMPLIEDSPACSAELTGNADDFKLLEYVLRRSVVSIVGSNSPANLASRPVKRLLLDEVDKFPDQTAKEARAVNLAIERTKTFWDRKILEISTPTTKAGYIYQSFLKGDQRRYFVPCHACGHMQVMKFPQFKFDSKLSIIESADKAYYECEQCEAAWDDVQRIAAVRLGEWRATAEPHERSHASFHLPAFLSPWVSLAEVVSMFRSTKNYPSEFQNFINSTLAELWEEAPKKAFSKERIVEIAKSNPYSRGQIPTKDETFIVATVDVQASHLVFSTWAMTMECHYLIDHGFLATLEDIELLRAARYKDAAGNIRRCARIMLDSGYDTMSVYRYALKNPDVILLKGEQGRVTRQIHPVRIANITSFPGGKMFGGNRQLRLLHIHHDHFKNELSRALDGAGNVKLFFHSDIDDGYIRQMCNEVLREGKPDKFGNVSLYWEKVGKNDYFDCAQYSFATRHMMHNVLLNLKGEKSEEEQAEPVGSNPRPPRVIYDPDEF